MVCFSCLQGVCQATVFTLFQDPVKIADKEFASGNYAQAAAMYAARLSKTPNDASARLKQAQAYYRTKDYGRAVAAYNQYQALPGHVLSGDDMYSYAEANATLGNRPVALDYYKRCLAQQPTNDLIAKKIWRLTNLQYLYEDSAHYAIRPVAVNTSAGELCAVPYKDGFVFTSNRKGARVIEKLNRRMNAPFYKLYQATWKEDTVTRTLMLSGKALPFGNTLKAHYNTGPVAFYQGGAQMVFVSASEKESATVQRTLGLYFAALQNGRWKVVSDFPHNSDRYSIHDVSISEDGKTLYFSSDMAGGLGGKDIYVSKLADGNWTKPGNAGDAINTARNEVFPYLHQDHTLYFSSDGHAGMGQLDIFKAQVEDDGYGEPENLGYPLNSPYDDFGLAFDSLVTHGYLSSNRRHGGYDDDVYEVDMDLQTYPFTVAALLKSKAHTWSDASSIVPWTKINVALVDSRSGRAVYETTTDRAGNFSIVIPYFSKYYVRVIDEDGTEYKASFELSKYQGEASIHEIVIVKDIFKKNNDGK
jgi:tetratricopeptide (TPR) repeat protein